MAKNKQPAEEPSLFELIKEGLEGSIAAMRTGKKLRVTHLEVPDPPPAYTAADVAHVRQAMNLSQGAFALLLGVSARAVKSWEQGQRTPTGGTARLLQFIQHPELLHKFNVKTRSSGPKAAVRRTERATAKRTRPW
jgi:putative transcriptional regulator